MMLDIMAGSETRDVGTRGAEYAAAGGGRWKGPIDARDPTKSLRVLWAVAVVAADHAAPRDAAVAGKTGAKQGHIPPPWAFKQCVSASQCAAGASVFGSAVAGRKGGACTGALSMSTGALHPQRAQADTAPHSPSLVSTAQRSADARFWTCCGVSSRHRHPAARVPAGAAPPAASLCTIAALGA